jgi:hypothetical protein
LTPHPLAVRVGRQARHAIIYDTDGVARALVPSDTNFPAVRLDGWTPQCGVYPHSVATCEIIFADDNSQSPSNCFTLATGFTLYAPIELAPQPTTTVYLPGMPVQISDSPPAALVEPDAPFYIVRLLPETNTMSVQCGSTEYLVPTETPSTHCMPTAGVRSVALISQLWNNLSAITALNTSLPGCDLFSFHSDLGVHVASEQCVPVMPGTEIQLESVSVCLADSESPQDTMTVELTRQMRLDSFLYATPN